jgi:hypothetical protein
LSSGIKKSAASSLKQRHRNTASKFINLLPNKQLYNFYSLIVSFPFHFVKPFPGPAQGTTGEKKGGERYYQPFFHENPLRPLHWQAMKPL